MADSTKVSAGKPSVAGSIYVAPADTALAKNDAATALPTTFKSLGYISEDGFSNNNSRSSDDTKDWSGAIVMSSQTEKKDTFKWTMIECMNEEVLKLVFGDSNVTAGSPTAPTVAKANSKELTNHAFAIDVLLNGNIPRRIYIPRGKVTEVSEVTYKATNAVAYEVTVTAYPDASDNTHYEYTGTAKVS